MRNKFTFGVLLILKIFLGMIFASMITAGLAFSLIKLQILTPQTVSPLGWIIFSLLFATFLALPFMLGANKRLLKPLNELIAANKKVAQGDFDVSVSTKKVKGELRGLVDSFNHMSKELASIEFFRKDFINNFSHEFKTPITSIRGFAKQLKKEDLSREQYQEYTDIIIAESDRLLNLSQNVLLLSKLETQPPSKKAEPFSLDEQIRNCILANQLHWEAKELRMQIDLAEITYYNNEEILAQLWQNLIDNAIKFSYDHGVITIKAQQFSDHIEVSIADQGQGMDEQTLAHIYDRFYQGDTSHGGAGNGLGLSIAKRITELVDGKIEVSSSENIGTEFKVTLPSY